MINLTDIYLYFSVVLAFAVVFWAVHNALRLLRYS